MTSYAEVPSDYDDDESEEERPKKAHKKRKASPKRAKKSPVKKKKKVESIHLSEWPDIATKEITPVCAAMITEIHKLDTLEVFAKPVIEAYPEMEDAYLEKIETPIDLRTIEEERVHQYESIKTLQNDLILMLQNCVTFNEGNEYADYALKIWRELNSVFVTVCEDQGVLLPRRWSP